MDVLTTRTLSYPGDDGVEKELVLTVFVPFEAEDEIWNCGFTFGPPLSSKIQYGLGGDFLQSFVGGLWFAHVYLKTWDVGRRAHWQGRPDCGLPSRAESSSVPDSVDLPPSTGSTGEGDVLTTRRLGYPDESGVEREILLTVFVPFNAEGEIWKCGFTVGPPESAPIRYGVGVDFIEALLDCLATVRGVFEGKAPKGWAPSGELLRCADLPYKIGRSFWMNPAGKPPTDRA